jgi:hypothetical protein
MIGIPHLAQSHRARYGIPQTSNRQAEGHPPGRQVPPPQVVFQTTFLRFQTTFKPLISFSKPLFLLFKPVFLPPKIP